MDTTFTMAQRVIAILETEIVKRKKKKKKKYKKKKKKKKKLSALFNSFNINFLWTFTSFQVSTLSASAAII